MTTSMKERLALLQKFGGDVARIQQCLLTSGRTVTPLQAVRMWLDYSESIGAAWLQLPADNGTLLAILLQHTPKTTMSMANPQTWQTTLTDAGDGSGDAVLELPDEWLAEFGWNEGDVLDVSITRKGISMKRKAR